MQDPKSLIEKILSGNIDEFKTFIKEYQRLVSHIVFRMIPIEADREDICQDVFVLVYENLGNFKFESKLSTWIAKIAYNRCINYLAKKKTPLLDDLSPAEASIEIQSNNSIAPDKLVEHQDRLSRL